ncbi:MAG: hypothetical protein ACFCD0_13400 [Gemmataceae bacterium]
MAEVPPTHCDRCGRKIQPGARQCLCGAVSSIPFKKSDQVIDADRPNPRKENLRVARSPRKNDAQAKRLRDTSHRNVEEVKYGESVPSAYEPSGEPGNLFILLAYGLFSLVVGALVGLLIGLVAAGINWVHSYLPFFLFVIPILVLIILAVNPIFVGMVTGGILQGGITPAKCRSPVVAGLVGFFTSVSALLLLWVCVELLTSRGLIAFVRLQVGGAFHFEFGPDFEPINVPAWVIYSILGITGLIGVIGATDSVKKSVQNVPYCEDCMMYMERRVLWSVSPKEYQEVRDALDAQDWDTAFQFAPWRRASYCVQLVLWLCDCDLEKYLEMYGRGQDQNEAIKDDIRVFSMIVTEEETEMLLDEASVKKQTRS